MDVATLSSSIGIKISDIIGYTTSCFLGKYTLIVYLNNTHIDISFGSSSTEHNETFKRVYKQFIKFIKEYTDNKKRKEDYIIFIKDVFTHHSFIGDTIYFS